MSNTVDYGIDLGTTNSAIARMTPKGPQIIPVRSQNYIPSVVAVDKRGALKVGKDALNVPELNPARLFKRLMGTKNTISLLDGQGWSPERLSSEILKALKAAAKLKTDEDIADVVITVPAMFTQPQCAATNEAAHIAGLNAVALLQEPIAAATACLSDDPVDGYYLVYDLGGGTFDVSLIRLQDREMNVVEHGGNNYLGGADFDRSVYNWVLNQINRKGGDTDQFRQDANKYRLMACCEEARIELSDASSTNIYLEEFDLPIAKIEFTRENLEDIVAEFVTQTIATTKDRVNTLPNGLKDVRAVLLVGGPTQMPYIRKRLQEELAIPINLEQDPMTVGNY
jgi:molecular chaperone DnaK